jgi:hypothetical protein
MARYQKTFMLPDERDNSFDIHIIPPAGVSQGRQGL